MLARQPKPAARALALAWTTHRSPNDQPPLSGEIKAFENHCEDAFAFRIFSQAAVSIRCVDDPAQARLQHRP
jgi:hypothetical protein